MDILGGVDPATAALILELQIEDSEEILASSGRKGKEREGIVSDTQLALRFYREDLGRSARIIADHQMTKSLSEACRTDGREVAISLMEEERANHDRQISVMVSDVTAPLAVTQGIVEEEDLDEVLERLDALYRCAAGEVPPLDDKSNACDMYSSTGSSQAGSSLWAASRMPAAPRRSCTACQEQFESCELGRAPCAHEYCGDCLQGLFKASMTDDTLFPPRCCREPITPCGNIRIYLSTDMVQQYEAKKLEFDTPNRTYCSNPVCSSFIQKEHILEERAYCQTCRTITCTICKLAAHRGDCPEDTALQLVLETAKENEWQRCYKCQRVVELDTGCNHMTCTCKAEFCYRCGEPWKTCPCAQWDENRFYKHSSPLWRKSSLRHTISVLMILGAALAADMSAKCADIFCHFISIDVPDVTYKLVSIAGCIGCDKTKSRSVRASTLSFEACRGGV
ncbi:hypothetical protein LZ554_007358 [Drepanopeziza brunnea f. sp. 'monogermtubi']|nr:hypothetical protein LZ554_007358 [Drepanopeziza brunnea f. sp. 'monogermtubi']